MLLNEHFGSFTIIGPGDNFDIIGMLKELANSSPYNGMIVSQ
jgi:hypothetical protein